MDNIESIILGCLVTNEDYSRRVIPFIRGEYFRTRETKEMFSNIQSFVAKYNALPSKEAMSVLYEEQNNLTEEEYNNSILLIDQLYVERDVNDDWLVEATEEFCKDRAIHNAILESIHIIEGKEKDKTVNVLPEILSDALSVCFDVNIGHDYLEDAEDRFDFYHRKEKKIAFDLDFFNTITAGGTPPKTLNIVMAGTGVGKSLFLCHHAANCLSQNLNVLYITCEMAEERIAERIDANLLDITIDDLHDLPKSMYAQKMLNLQQKIQGQLIVKEYPTATANANHFKALLKELKLKKKFVPDVIFIDYLNICASTRLKGAANQNSYLYIKAIAEELRGLAVEHNVPVFSATQTNRSGYSNTDVSLEDTSESFGLPATADFMFALISTEELEELGQILVKQLKNRYNDAFSNKKFIIGMNRAKMKLFNVERSEQSGLSQSNQVEKEEHGNGFGPKTFDEKFGRGKEKFKEWSFT
jgi:replicative DNA helicase